MCPVDNELWTAGKSGGLSKTVGSAGVVGPSFNWW